MPVTTFDIPEKYRYHNGFGSYIETEAVPGALPVGQNSPQKPPHGLYAEKLSGTAFTAPRAENQQSWLYRIVPSCAHPAFAPDTSEASPFTPDRPYSAQQLRYVPDQLRWDPFDHHTATATDDDGGGDDGSAATAAAAAATEAPDFVQGLRLLAGAGDPTLKQGLGVYAYGAARSMDARAAFSSADGDLLLVPQEGALDVRTELGWLLVRPLEICVVPRGVKFQVRLAGGRPARGYALELYQGHFALPELGPLGSNALANARDFQAPVASFEEAHGATASAAGDGDGDDAAPVYTVTAKFNHGLFVTRQAHSPFDVVAWHGNYYPYKYDLGRFNTMGSISYDHPDPSVFTVLTAPSERPGTAVADFVIFPPRWLVAADTFRPPWYHRNTMAEFMGLIGGEYDAKKGGAGGFRPGGASLHNVMAGHGPDAASYEAARDADLAPQLVGRGSCAFMFETSLMLGVTEWGLRTCQKVQTEYNDHSWGGLKVHWKRPEGARLDTHLLNPE